MNWNKIVWLAIIAAAIGFEIFTAATRRTTLTDMVTDTKYFPWFLIMPFVFWLPIHFAIHYHQAGKFPAWVVKIFVA